MGKLWASRVLHPGPSAAYVCTLWQCLLATALFPRSRKHQEEIPHPGSHAGCTEIATGFVYTTVDYKMHAWQRILGTIDIIRGTCLIPHPSGLSFTSQWPAEHAPLLRMLMGHVHPAEWPPCKGFGPCASLAPKGPHPLCLESGFHFSENSRQLP